MFLGRFIPVSPSALWSLSQTLESVLLKFRAWPQLLPSHCLDSVALLARPGLYVTVVSLVPCELHVSVSHQAGFNALPVRGRRLDATWNASYSMTVLDGWWHATVCEAAMEVL